MTDKISRRDFLKLAGTATAAGAILTGCGPASRYVVREPYTQMPEYTYNGQSTYYATTCRECPAGCGLVVRTMQGRAIKVEGNPNNPLNLGKTCARGQASLQGLYNPDRVQSPTHKARGQETGTEITWDEAIAVVKDALAGNQPDEIAFLMGMAPDHLFDLVSQLTSALKAPAPLRFGAYEMFENRATLAEVSKRTLGKSGIPYFDIGNADVVFSFGANFLETWLSPVAWTRGFSRMRKAKVRGTLIQFEPRLSQTAAVADEWIPVKPGTEGLAALALGRLVAELRSPVIPAAYKNVDVAALAEACFVEEEKLRALAELLFEAENPLILPGCSALGSSNGLEAGEAIMTLNALLGNLGRSGGVYLIPELPVGKGNDLPNSFSDLYDLVGRMQAGKIKVLFVHGTNPVYDLPSALGFEAALANIPLVISFASFPDETALQADYIFPDHTGLESWGYQKVQAGADRPVLSGAQPVVVPFYNTRATADILLAAVAAIGGNPASALPYADEVAFLQSQVLDLVKEDGFFNAPEINTFWASFQQYGGWWTAESKLETPPGADTINRNLRLNTAEFDGESEFHLFPFLSPILGDGSGANKPWLQETPDPTTTVMWNTWVEIHPQTADELGLHDDDVVRLASPYGEIEASVYRYPAIRPDTLGLVFGQGHTAYGRYAAGRGVNPVKLLPLKINGAGGLATHAIKVDIEKTGRQKPLARAESQIDVYEEE